MEELIETFKSLDNLWPQHWQHFTLGCLFGAILGVLWLIWAFKTGKIKT